MKQRVSLCALLLALLGLPVGLRAERIERSFPISPDAVVEVRSQIGQVRLQSWNQPRIRVVATRNSRAVEIHFEETANRLHIHTHVLEAAAATSDRTVDYEIWVPAQAHLYLYLETGSLLVENFAEDVTIEAAAASVTLRRLSGHTSVKTLSGSVVADRCSGRLEATTVSGTLRFLNTNSRYLAAESTSGDIFYEGGVRAGGTYEFRNHDGLVELVLPAAASFELDAHSVRGQVTSDFPLTPRNHGRLPQRPGASSLLGTVHSGEAMVRVTSFSGTIRLRRQ